MSRVSRPFPNSSIPQSPNSLIRHLSFVIRHSLNPPIPSFVIRHSPFPIPSIPLFHNSTISFHNSTIPYFPSKLDHWRFSSSAFLRSSIILYQILLRKRSWTSGTGRNPNPDELTADANESYVL